MNCWTVEIVCTDRGQHKRRWLGRMIWDAPWEPSPVEADAYRQAMAGPLRTPEEVEHLIGRRRRGGWGTFIQDPDSVKHVMFGPPLESAEPGELTSRESYGFACSGCTRRPEIKRERWIALMDGARVNALPEFDVSYLD